MKRIFLLLLIINYQLSIINSSAQPVIQWQKCLGGTASDGALSIIQTSDGGFIMAGASSSNDGDVSGNHGGADYWVVKLDNMGTIQWQKCLGGTGNDEAYSIIQTFDGGYAVVGVTGSNDGDVSGNHGGYDYWVVKINNVGTIQWQKCLGGMFNDFGNIIVQTSDSGYALAGVTSSNDGDVSGNHGDRDNWVVKLDNAGTIQWQKCYGGTGDEGANAIIQTTDGGYALAGMSNSNDGDVSGNHGDYDYWVIKVDNAGTIQWQKSYGGTILDWPYSIVMTTDGGYAIAGITESNNGDVNGNHGSYDSWIVKVNNVGTIQWQKCLGGTSDDWAYSIIQTSNDNYVIIGESISIDGDVVGNHGGDDYWVARINNVGTIQWQKCLGGTSLDQGSSIKPSNDGGYIIAGYASSNDGDVSGNHGGSDSWVVKLGPDVVNVEETSNSPLSIYPNPFTTQATINFNKEVYNATFSLHNLLGEKVAEVSGINGASYRFNRSNLRSGVYVFEVSEGRSIWRGKAVVY